MYYYLLKDGSYLSMISPIIEEEQDLVEREITEQEFNDNLPPEPTKEEMLLSAIEFYKQQIAKVEGELNRGNQDN